MSDSAEAAKGPRRFLIATVVADYPKDRTLNRTGLVEARDRIIDLFTRQLGYRLHDPLPLSPTKLQLTDALRAFCSSKERREDDELAFYLSCHGGTLDDGDEHVLYTTDTDPDDLTYTSLPTAELTRVMLRDSQISRVMLLLDACYIGLGGNQLTAAALKHLGPVWGRKPGAGLVVVSSAQPHQLAHTGVFPKLLQQAVTDLSVAGHVPTTLSVDAIVQHMNRSKDLPGDQRISQNRVGFDGEPPAFFPNPRHDPRLNEVDLALQQAAAFDAQDRKRDAELTTRLLVRAMGYQGRPGDDLAAPAWWFSGREAALRHLGEWLSTPSAPDSRSCRVVTAGPGSGKTAVLGLIAALSHPERRRAVPLDALDIPPGLIAPGTLDTAVYAQGLSDTDVLDAICAAARITTPAKTVGELLDALAHRSQPLSILVDALDEAATPHTLCTTVLRPLIEHSRGRIRLLLGTRPYLLPRLGIDPADTEQVVDLDSPRYADHQALVTYTARTLLQSRTTSPYREHPAQVRPVASAVARAAGNSFLIARLTAGTLAATPVIPDPSDPVWQASLPRHAGDAMREDLHRRLGPHAQRATDLLRPLAYAQGQGLPWEDIWASLATAVSGRTLTDDDLLWLRNEAGSYVVEATENHRSAYRLYHEAMAEHLREDTDGQAVHAACVRVLTDRVPYRADGARDWSRAHPYTLAHLAHHAARAGLLDQVLEDAEYLVHADPRGLTPHLHHARHHTARLSAAVYRHGLHLHLDTTPDRRRQVLALEAARAGAHRLHHDLTQHTPAGTWTPQWATGNTFNPALRDTLTGHSPMVHAVAVTTLDERPVAVTASGDGTARVWDLTAGRQIGEPLVGHSGGVEAVACTVLDNRPVAITTGADGTLRLWDLTNHQPIGEPLTGHSGAVKAVTCTVLDNRPVAITTGADGTLKLCDLTNHQPIGEPLTKHRIGVTAVACTVLDDRPVAIIASLIGGLQVWDLMSRQPIGPPLDGRPSLVTSLACTTLDDRPVVVTGNLAGPLRIWDLTTRQSVGEPLTGYSNSVRAVVCTLLDNRPVAVTANADGTVRIWDLPTGPALPSTGRTVLTGPSSTVRAVTCTVVDDRPAAVTAGLDGTVQIWDLTTHRPIGPPLTDLGTRVACTTLDDRPAAVTADKDGTVRIWDLTTRRRIGDPLTGHTGPVTALVCTTFNDRPAAVTAGEDGTLRVWDLTSAAAYEWTPRGVYIAHRGTIAAVTCTVLNGYTLAVTAGHDGTVRVWDLTMRQRIREFLTGRTSTVTAVACTTVDGQFIGVIASADGTVQVWDLITCQPTGEPLRGHTGAVRQVTCAVLDDRPVAITASADATVRIWDLTTRRGTVEILISDPRALTLTNTSGLMVGFDDDLAFYEHHTGARAR
ncbi:hypothetical protein [Kitasatospora sp. NPDC004289]